MYKVFFAFAVLVFIVLQFRFWHDEQGLPALIQANRQVAVYEAMNRKLQERNAVMKNEILDLQQGLEAVESRARKELGMIKSGEIFYRTIETNPNTTKKPATDEK